jgi:alcohol dehydrogenase (cytochrome c)
VKSLVEARVCRRVAFAAVVCLGVGFAQDLAPNSTVISKEVTNFTPVTDQYLRNPSPNDWIMMRGNYEMWGYSKLDQINRKNVGQLTLVWARVMGQVGANEGAPLVHDGTMFLPNPWGQVQALNAATGDLIWDYHGVGPMTRETLHTVHFGQLRSVFLYEGNVYVIEPDNTLVALNARTGKEVWKTPRGGNGYVTNSSGPIVVNGAVIAGCTTQSGPTPCDVTAHDAETGKELWRNHTVPRAGEKGDDTWRGVPYEKRWCTGVWGEIAYDSVLDLVHYGSSGNCPGPDVQRGVAGLNATNFGTDTRFAVRPKTGEIVWSHQVLPQDNWDQECTFDMMIVDTATNPHANAEAMYAVNPKVAGQKRRTLSGMPCKTPVFWSFDSKTGEFIYARQPWKFATNLIQSIDAAGQVSINQDMVLDKPGKTVVFCTSFFGGRDWPSGVYDPARHIMIQPTSDRCTEATSKTDPLPAPQFSYNISTKTVPNPNLPQGDNYPAARITAVKVETGETAWQYQQHAGIYSPLLATAGGLLFTNDVDRYFSAHDLDTGKTIWKTRLGTGGSGTTVTYSVGGRQYIAVVASANGVGNPGTPLQAGTDSATGGGGNMIWVFALPAAK